jgi:hypothetical protein
MTRLAKLHSGVTPPANREVGSEAVANLPETALWLRCNAAQAEYLIGHQAEFVAAGSEGKQ